MTNLPLKIYQQHIHEGDIQPDEQQRRAIEKLDKIFQALSEAQHKTFFSRFKPKKAIKGLYLWGSVGIGKTYLMNLFYDCADFPKLRMHFFTFMLDIHKKLQQRQGQKNPLTLIAKEIAAKTKVICFDEFFVTNIADAMILGELFKSLFAEGIVLIATSNSAPDHLYKNGLQRERFLPAIAALKAHTDILHLDKDNDYRKQQKKPASVYFFPLDDHSKAQMRNAFDYFNITKTYDSESLIINSHSLTVIRKHQGILWCDFKELCQANRSTHDYIAIAKNFHTVLIDSIRQMHSKDRRTILRFVHMIDIFYDEHVRVIISAETAAQQLYPKGPHQFEFQRTLSRLIEMQSKNYFARDDELLI